MPKRADRRQRTDPTQTNCCPAVIASTAAAGAHTAPTKSRRHQAPRTWRITGPKGCNGIAPAAAWTAADAATAGVPAGGCSAAGAVCLSPGFQALRPERLHAPPLDDSAADDDDGQLCAARECKSAVADSPRAAANRRMLRIERAIGAPSGRGRATCPAAASKAASKLRAQHAPRPRGQHCYNCVPSSAKK